MALSKGQVHRGWHGCAAPISSPAAGEQPEPRLFSVARTTRAARLRQSAVIWLLLCLGATPTLWGCSEDTASTCVGDATAADAATSSEACPIEGFCASRGLCGLSPAGWCVARNSEDCLRSHACRVAGYCLESGGQCVFDPDLDCRYTIGCLLVGTCHNINGACRPKTELDCQNSDFCASNGLCAYWDGDCTANGNNNGVCAEEEVCTASGQCTAMSGVCVATSSEDCEASEGCSAAGRCALVDGKCRAVSDEMCAQSEQCQFFGWCALGDEGRCRATLQAHCDIRSAHWGCDKGACVLAPSGDCHCVGCPKGASP